MKFIGIILITLGFLMAIIPGFMIPVKKNILKVGDIELNKTEHEWLGWPVYTGGVLIIGGVIIILLDKNRQRS